MQKRMTIADIGGGELVTLVNREIVKVCENIADPACKTDGVRTITVKIKVKPDKKGTMAAILYQLDRDGSGNQGHHALSGGCSPG